MRVIKSSEYGYLAICECCKKESVFKKNEIKSKNLEKMILKNTFICPKCGAKYDSILYSGKKLNINNKSAQVQLSKKAKRYLVAFYIILLLMFVSFVVNAGINNDEGHATPVRTESNKSYEEQFNDMMHKTYDEMTPKEKRMYKGYLEWLIKQE